MALILVDGKGENLISVASGANHALTPEDVAKAADAIRAADVVLLQLETPIGNRRLHGPIGGRGGRGGGARPGAAPDAPLDGELLGHVAYLTPNETEAERLTGIRVTDEASARAAAAKLLRSGARHAIITLGTKGALVASPDRMVLIPSFPVEARDSTAAGDAFNGGLACALARGMSLEDAVREASLVGALSVTRLGAQPSLPTVEELRRFAATVGK